MDAHLLHDFPADDLLHRLSDLRKPGDQRVPRHGHWSVGVTDQQQAVSVPHRRHDGGVDPGIDQRTAGGAAHALIFAAGQGIPLIGVVYDPKVSAFLRYIGQDLFVSLADVTAKQLCAMIDRAVERTEHPEEQEAAVARLQEMERRNVETAKRLMGNLGG